MKYWNCTVLCNNDFLLDPAPCRMISICFKMGFHGNPRPLNQMEMNIWEQEGRTQDFWDSRHLCELLWGKVFASCSVVLSKHICTKWWFFFMMNPMGSESGKNILKWTIIEIRVFEPMASLNIRMITNLKANSFQSFESPLLTDLSYIMAHHFFCQLYQLHYGLCIKLKI